jgi:hypothetical protein
MFDELRGGSLRAHGAEIAEQGPQPDPTLGDAELVVLFGGQNRRAHGFDLRRAACAAACEMSVRERVHRVASS